MTKPDVIAVSLCIERYAGLQHLYIRILKLCPSLRDESASTGANLCLLIYAYCYLYSLFVDICVEVYMGSIMSSVNSIDLSSVNSIDLSSVAHKQQTIISTDDPPTMK